MSKGSGRRPTLISRAQADANYEAIFGPSRLQKTRGEGMKSGISMGNIKVDDFHQLSELSRKDLEFATKIIQWGQWAGSGIFPHCSKKQGYSPSITDDEALEIDGIIAKMQSKPKYVLIQMYLYNNTIEATAKMVKLSKHSVSNYRDIGLSFLYGALTNKKFDTAGK